MAIGRRSNVWFGLQITQAGLCLDQRRIQNPVMRSSLGISLLKQNYVGFRIPDFSLQHIQHALRIYLAIISPPAMNVPSRAGE